MSLDIKDYSMKPWAFKAAFCLAHYYAVGGSKTFHYSKSIYPGALVITGGCAKLMQLLTSGASDQMKRRVEDRKIIEGINEMGRFCVRIYEGLSYLLPLAMYAESCHFFSTVPKMRHLALSLLTGVAMVSVDGFTDLMFSGMSDKDPLNRARRHSI